MRGKRKKILITLMEQLSRRGTPLCASTKKVAFLLSGFRHRCSVPSDTVDDAAYAKVPSKEPREDEFDGVIFHRDTRTGRRKEADRVDGRISTARSVAQTSITLRNTASARISIFSSKKKTPQWNHRGNQSVTPCSPARWARLKLTIWSGVT